MPIYPASEPSTSMSSLERKSPSSVRPSPIRPPCAPLRPRDWPRGKADSSSGPAAGRCAAARWAGAIPAADSRERYGRSGPSGRSRGSGGRTRSVPPPPGCQPWDAAIQSAPSRAVPEVDRARLLRRQEHRHPRNQQGLGQPLDNGIDQRAQIGLRVQAAAKVDQRLAIVEVLLVEDRSTRAWIIRFTGSKTSPVTMIATSKPPDPSTGSRVCTTLHPAPPDRSTDQPQPPWPACRSRRA